MVRPVGVDHLDFGDGGLTLLLVAEVRLEHLDVVEVHGKASLGDERLQPRVVELGEAVDDLDGLRLGVDHLHRVAR